MNKKTRPRHVPEYKVRILRLHLLEGKPILEICEAEGIHPTLIYQWQKTFFEKGTVAFESARSPSRGFGQAEPRLQEIHPALANHPCLLFTPLPTEQWQARTLPSHAQRAGHPSENSTLPGGCQTRRRQLYNHYNHVRLLSATAYITAAHRLSGRHTPIFAARNKKLEAAREQQKSNANKNTPP